MPEQRKSPLMTTTEAAQHLRLKPHTLENMRWQGTGPKFRKHGGRVLPSQGSEGMVRQQPATILVGGQGLSLRPALLASISVLALVTSVPAENPWMVWNASASVPVGLYRIEPSIPVRDDLALVKLPPKTALLADHRGYLPNSAYLLKPVAATAGDRVCRIGRYVLVSGRSVAIASSHDRQRRALPAWHGCYLLAHGEVFLLGTTSDSFDSRYFGLITRDHIVGRAMPIWTLK